jgi:3-methyladenine DNA glycosylase AlkD
MREWIEKLEALYALNANASNAAAMEKYMKHLFSFYGIPASKRRPLDKKFLEQYGPPALDAFDELARTAFSHPMREIHYFAIDRIAAKPSALPASFIDTALWMVTNKSWWDSVDPVATQIIGGLLKKHESLRYLPEEWVHSNNIWLVRTALLYQLKYKQKTDVERLLSFIRLHWESKAFFVQKAMGWALREYSKTDSGLVTRFIQSENLPSLTKREGMKWLQKKTDRHG